MKGVVLMNMKGERIACASPELPDLSVYYETSGTADVIRDVQIPETYFTPVTALPDNHAFAFCVRAGNLLGYGDWSDYAMFQTGTGDPTLHGGGSGVGGNTGTGTATKEIAYSPKSNVYRSWEPLVYYFGTGASEAVNESITRINGCYQGYTFYSLRNYDKLSCGSSGDAHAFP